MIDHFTSFPTEADAKAHPALSPWLNEGAWDASCVFIVELVTADAVYEGETLVSPRGLHRPCCVHDGGWGLGLPHNRFAERQSRRRGYGR